MQNCVDFLPRKSFNTYGVVLLTLFGLFAVVVISISGSLAFDTSFHCYDKSISKTKEVSLTKNVNIKCSLKYQEKYHFILPMYAMFILNFGIVFSLSIIYGYLVKHRVEKFDYPTRTATANNDGDENQAMLASLSTGQNARDVRECLGHFSTFAIYIVHLVIARIIPSLVFASVFYLAYIPNNFSCPWQSEIQGKGTSSFNDTLNSRQNFTIIDCTNPIGRKSKTLVDFFATVDVIIVTLAFSELGYIGWLAFNDRDFMTDQEFCTVYLLRKRKRIIKLVDKFRERFDIDDQGVFQLKDDFGDTNISSRLLEDIYVNEVIQEGRERANAYPETFDRHRIYQSHLKTPSTVTKLTSTADIFKPKKDDQSQTYPRTILVIGRPGIGKTMLTRRLLQQWKEKGDQFWFEKIVILLQFRTLNNKNVTLREMLGFAEGLSLANFPPVYDFILSSPTKIVLIFDGLDELTVDNELLCTNNETVSNPNEKMPVFSLFKMLADGRLLPGVTVLTTSRPTAQQVFENLNFERTVEILGFFEEQIKEYVSKFCKNDNNDTSELIWNQIKESGELLSLCYVPVNSYIVCLTLKESIQNDESGLQRNVPKTITELYKRAVKVLIYRHHPIYKLQPRPSDYFITRFPKELENDLLKLKEVAESGISQGKLIFERTTDDEFGDLANCGLFHKLPDKRQNFFCFLHLTLQEFLAASKVVDDIDKVEQFLATQLDDPKWHLVIQFVAGLVGDKIKEAKMADKGVPSEPKESKYQEWQEILPDIQKRLEEWVFLLRSEYKPSKLNALLGIKCLHELQDIDVMKSVSRKFFAKGDGELCLRSLNITPVDCAALFEFLGNSKNLKRLKIQECTIQGNQSYRKIEKSLFNNADNAIASFTWDPISEIEGVKYLSNALKGEHCKLTELHLKAASKKSNADMIDQTLEYLSEALESANCKLVKLNLSNNKITDQGVKCLSEALESESCKLTELNLGYNEVTGQGVGYLSEALKSKNCKLVELNLGINGINDKDVANISEALKSENCELRKLNLHENKITDQGAEYLSEALKSENCKLTQLNLERNKITDQGVKILSEALKIENCKLTELNLGGNVITDQGVEYLSEALKSENCKLTQLDLSDNKVRDQGVDYLGEALKSENCKLIKLSLRLNKITDQGAKYLGEALKSDNFNLKELDLGYNEIPDQGVKYLSEALKHENCKLVTLNLGDNKLTEQSFVYLSEASKSENCKLTTLYISDWISNEGQLVKPINTEGLVEAAKKNIKIYFV